MTTNVHHADPSRERDSLEDSQRPTLTLTLTETAHLLGVSPWLVQQQVAQGVLPCVRLGRRVLISRSRLLAWLETGR